MVGYGRYCTVCRPPASAGMPPDRRDPPPVLFIPPCYLFDAEMMASEGKYNDKPDKTAAGAAVCVGVTLFCFASKVTRRRFRQPVYWRRDTLRLKTRYQPASYWHRL